MFLYRYRRDARLFKSDIRNVRWRIVSTIGLVCFIMPVWKNGSATSHYINETWKTSYGVERQRCGVVGL